MVIPPMLIAIDPGAISGAFALFADGRPVHVGDLAVVDGQLDAAALSRLLREMAVRVAVVERVGAMPAQGVASTWKFAFACGIIHGTLASCEIPINYVAPHSWKRHYNLGKDKEKSRARAIELFPAMKGLNLKRNHGRAEALLMGQWFLSKGETT